MPKELIAIVTSHAPKYRERANAQRATWVQHAPQCGYTLKFFLGNPPNGERPGNDEVFLDAGDGYKSLPEKTQQLCRWAYAAGFDFLCKMDDDVYCNMMALQHAPHPHDYVGRFRGPSGGYPSDYASGYTYWLSRRAMLILANSPLTDDWAEDRWAANALANAGIAGYSDDWHYVACYPPVRPEMVFRGQLRNRATFCEYPPDLMRKMYAFHKATPVHLAAPVELRHVPLLTEAPVSGPENYSESEPQKVEEVFMRPSRDLSNLSVLVKTFLRDGLLFDCMAGLQKNFPEVQIVIMDDGAPTAEKDELYLALRAKGHVCTYLPFDSGFGEKANFAIPLFTRPYVLIASDDFDFSDPDARWGIENMVTVLQEKPELAVASGRVDNNPYEAIFEIHGSTVREIPLQMGTWQKAADVLYKECSLTVNYSVIRSNILGFGPQQIHWDGGAVKIGGGEHGAFFYDLAKAGYRVAFVPGANITTFRYDPSKQDPAYDAKRARARAPGRECFRKRGITHWILQDGTTETA